MRSRWLFLAALVFWGAGAARDEVGHWVAATELPPLEAETGVEVRDRAGELLRAYTVADGRWRLGVQLSDVDPAYIAMLIRYEDKRFYDHAGVDPRALLRAAWQAVRSGGIVSGGSTLTMQTARLLEDGTTGRWSGKVRQIQVALALEQQLTKDEILTLYLNRTPFGGNLEGVRAASLAWFGKPPRRLTPAEAALLVALPQSPEARRPDRHAAAATQARNRVLDLMAEARVLDHEEARAAHQTPVSALRRPFPQWAAHVADRVTRANPTRQVHNLTVSRPLQTSLETLAAQSVEGHQDRRQTAIVVADHQTGQILASVGSASYSADGRAGFVDLTQAKRSPGSTLKPLVYALAFDRGLAHPETLIADRPMDFDGYRPQNFDGVFRGDLRIRHALQQSLNLPVVALTEAIGPHHLMAAMKRAGIAPRVPGDVPGLAVALGGVGVSLTELVQLYAGLAQQGMAVPLITSPETDAPPPQQITGPVAAWYVADILLQTPRPAGVQARGIAYKTGTSYGHRDAWAIGFDGRHVVGVWMGRADGTPIPGAFGGELAAPVMFQAFARLKPQVDPIPAPPPAALLVDSTKALPAPLQRFGPPPASQTTPNIAFPPDGATVQSGPLFARVREGSPPFTWLADGEPVMQSHQRQVDLGLFDIGFSALTVIDAHGASDRVAITVE